eukprot:6870007-Prymnesium_polylepis.1
MHAQSTRRPKKLRLTVGGPVPDVSVRYRGKKSRCRKKIIRKGRNRKKKETGKEIGRKEIRRKERRCQQRWRKRGHSPLWHRRPPGRAAL